jgi:hypothetical protein
MARPSATRDRRRRYGWRRPRWRDGAFWAAVGLTAVVVAVQLVLVDWSANWVWVGVAARVLITWFVISACIRIRVGIQRGLVDGFNEAQQKAASRPEGPAKGEAMAKAGGRLAGKALGAAKRRQR